MSDYFGFYGFNDAQSTEDIAFQEETQFNTAQYLMEDYSDEE